jgi:hypothetical protein
VGEFMLFSLENIRKAISGLKEDLGDAFIQTDIWHSKQLKSVAYTHTRGLLPMYGVVTKHIKIISQISRTLKKTLVDADYPFNVDYFLINLEGNKALLVLYYNIKPVDDSNASAGRPADPGEEMSEYQQFILVDMNHTTMGILIGNAIPNMLEIIK